MGLGRTQGPKGPQVRRTVQGVLAPTAACRRHRIAMRLTANGPPPPPR